MKYVASLLVLIFFAVSFVSVAQTQQGIAKTKGRLNVDGSVTPGQKLQGVAVKVKGRTPVLSGANGEFSFPVRGGKYSLDGVTKKGYALVDPEMTSRQYSYSAGNPLTIVMETPDDRADDELANERRIRRSLQRQLMAKEDEIERLREENRITQEEYRARLQELYSRQETSEQLIGKMVEYYSGIDYDQLDDFNRRISTYILNGDLSRADSLLRTKGDIGDRIAALERHRSANAEEPAELTRRQEQLSRSEAFVQKELEDIAADCRHKFDIFKMQYSNDSAAYYIELRASLDTANVQWQLDAGSFIGEYLADYGRAMEYYRRAFDNAMMQDGENSVITALCLDKIGSMYYFNGNYPKALEYCRRALDLRISVLGDKHIDVAGSIAHVGLIYGGSGDYSRALEYDKQALEIINEVSGEDSTAMASIIGNMGIAYIGCREYVKALECFDRSIRILLKVYGEDNAKVAIYYNNIGTAYSALGNYDKAAHAYNNSLKTMLEIFGENHPNVSMGYNNMGVVYARSGDYDKALEYFKNALKISENCFGYNHPSVAMRLNNIGGIYYYQGKLDEAYEAYLKSFEIYRRLLGDKHPTLAESYICLGLIHADKNELEKAMDCYDKAYEIFVSARGEQDPAVAECLVNMGEVYFKQGCLDEACKCARKALEIVGKSGGDTAEEANELLYKINKKQ